MPTQRKRHAQRIDSEELAVSITEVTAAIDHERRQALQSAYQVGRAIELLYQRWRQEDRHSHGDEAEAQFIEQLGNTLLESDEWLHEQWRLAQAFDEDQFQRLSDVPGVNTVNVERLVEADAEVRSQLLDKIIAEGPIGRKLDVALQQLAVPA